MLSDRIKYNLVSMLANLVRDPGNVPVVLDDIRDERNLADIRTFNYGNVIINGVPARTMWDNIVTEIEEQELLVPLLNAMMTHFPNNNKLTSFYNEVTNGFERRLEAIAKACKGNQCVLFIGPRLLTCSYEGIELPFNQFFALKLFERFKIADVYCDKKFNDDITYIANRYEDLPNVANRELGKEAQKCFETNNVLDKNNYIFEKLTKLNCRLIISTNPDKILDKVFSENNISYSSDFYDRSNSVKNNNDLNEENTIIYKIFGSFDNPYSILFTDNDRVQFTKNVVRNDPPIPPVVKVLLENKLCLFIGFDFMDWHLKILIDCLGLTKREDGSFALMKNVNQSNIEYFEKNYNFYFINEEMDHFLDDLIKRLERLP